MKQHDSYFSKLLDSENDYESAVENSIALSPQKDLCLQFGNIGLNEEPKALAEISEAQELVQTVELKNENCSSIFLKEDKEDENYSTSFQLFSNSTKDKECMEKESKGDVNNTSKVDIINKGDSQLTDTNKLEEISDYPPEPISVDIQDIERISNQLAVEDPKVQRYEVTLII